MFKFEKLEPIFRRVDAEKHHGLKSRGGLIVNSNVLNSEVEHCDKGILIPLARSGHRAFFHSGLFYIIGGYRTDHDSTLVDVWTYFPLMHHWTRVEMSTEVPSENLSCASTVVRDRVYQYGGSGASFGHTNSDKIFLLDLENRSFSHIKSESSKETCPPPGYGNSLTYSEINDCLYLCCGTNGFNYFSHFYKFTLDDRKWSIVPQNKECVTARYRQESFVWRQNWYIIGGSYQSECHDMSCMYKFSFISERWELIPILPCTPGGYPASRRGFGTVVYKDRLYVIGGSHFESNSFVGGLVQDVGFWYIDLNSMRWNLIKNCALPKPLDFFAIAVDGYGKVLLHGGRDQLENNLRSVQTYIVWLDVPPLVELCWETIKIWQKESFVKLSLSQLMSYGVPRKIADQITQFYRSCLGVSK